MSEEKARWSVSDPASSTEVSLPLDVDVHELAELLGRVIGSREVLCNSRGASVTCSMKRSLG
jgi:predicted secreted protein